MMKTKVDFLAIIEIKRGGKGEESIGDNILLYSGTTKDRIASTGVGCMYKEALMNTVIKECKFVGDRLMEIDIKLKEML